MSCMSKNYVWNFAHANMKMENLLASIMDDSAINCDEIIESYDEEINFNERKQPSKCKVSIFFFFFHFY